MHPPDRPSAGSQTGKVRLRNRDGARMEAPVGGGPVSFAAFALAPSAAGPSEGTALI